MNFEKSTFAGKPAVKINGSRPQVYPVTMIYVVGLIRALSRVQDEFLSEQLEFIGDNFPRQYRAAQKYLQQA
jgi:hypothetical protein